MGVGPAESFGSAVLEGNIDLCESLSLWQGQVETRGLSEQSTSIKWTRDLTNPARQLRWI